MKSESFKIGKISVTVIAWGFIEMMNFKKKYLGMLIKPLQKLSNEYALNESSLDDGLANITTLIPVIDEFLSSFSEKELNEFIRQIIKNVSVQKNESTPMPLSVEILDEFFSGNSSDFYQLCWCVIKTNFGDIVGKLKTLIEKNQQKK